MCIDTQKNAFQLGIEKYDATDRLIAISKCRLSENQMLMRLTTVVAVIFWIVGGAAQIRAESPSASGHLKISGAAGWYDDDAVIRAQSGSPTEEAAFDGRVNLLQPAGPFTFTADTQLLSVSGDRVRAVHKTPLLFSNSAVLPNDERRLFDLTADLSDSDSSETELRLDRLAAQYERAGTRIRAGRAAVTWGNGLAFQVLDRFNPFAPTAIDTDYKPGDDLVHIEQRLDDRHGVEALYVPRRDPATDSVNADVSSFAVRSTGQQLCNGFDLELLAARHYGRALVGGGLSHELLEGVARGDVSLERLDSGEDAVSFLVNYDRSWTVLDMNVYGFAEFYHNGVGSSDDRPSPDADAFARLARGELFVLGRDYSALGGRLEATDRLNVYANWLQNLHDRSRYLQSRAVFDITQDLQWVAGINIPLGADGSEFGGVEIPGSELRRSPGRELYTRLLFYW